MKFPDSINTDDVGMVLNELQLVGYKVSKARVDGRDYGVVIKEYCDDGKYRDAKGACYSVRAVYRWDGAGDLIRD